MKTDRKQLIIAKQIPGDIGSEIRRRAEQKDLERSAVLHEKRMREAKLKFERLAEGGRRDRKGSVGTASGRLGHKMRLTAHTAPSRTLKAIYPWIMDRGLGAPGAYIGQELFSLFSFLFDPFELYKAGVITSPNISLVGEIGSGKSALQKSMIIRLAAFGIRFSWTQVKPEYELVCAAMGVAPLRLGPGQIIKLNPLAAFRKHPDQTNVEWLEANRSRRTTLMEGLLEIDLGRSLTPTETSVLGWALDAVTGQDKETVQELAPASMPAVLAALINPDRWKHRAEELGFTADQVVTASGDLRLGMGSLMSGSLRGMFDSTEERNTAFDFQAPGTLTDLSAVMTNQKQLLMAMVCSQSAMEAELLHPEAPRRIVGYDEAWLAMQFLPLLRRYQAQWKLCRLFGISNMLAMHRFTDTNASGAAGSVAAALMQGLLEDTGIQIAYRQRPKALEMTQEFMKLSDVQTYLLQFLKVGVGLWKIGEKPLVVRHSLARAERPLIHTDSRMEAIAGIDDISDSEWEELLESTLLLDA